ncbi:hypothetical protein Aph01nite_10160 [Acrocarpospora phusangensis]|uniref:Uncharacterized protein n=1 Tax=Acrocarpospora phusangensis TaxID=1070424 RepID=A0A919Q5U7_9ACTN|nr:hypothetical protein [Acrocarpospora phusangensis]GIH22706.1 hypothetical protein Aph01nite_10160 [Acrocarpospora phusangensis]
MFWPDDSELALQEWWGVPAWAGGPVYGALVTAVRPALRAALLLGYEVTSINLGFGAGVSAEGEWQAIDGGTLELAPGAYESVEKQSSGPTLWLEVLPFFDRADDQIGSYAIPFEFGLFGGEESTSDGSVPAGIAAAVDDVVARAVDALTATLPSREAWRTAGGLPRRADGGLLWILDPAYQTGLGSAAGDLASVVEALLADREAFLLGQVYGERVAHAGNEPGPASLRFLLDRQLAWPRRAHRRIWAGLLADLQARGEAHRLWERERGNFQGRSAPTWLDVLSQLIWRGVVTVHGLYEAEPAPYPLAAAAPTGDPDERITLTVWGATVITIWREVVFADGGGTGLHGCVAWDYAPGDARTKPTVILVAGRGITIDHANDAPEDRPWQLEIFRVQDDRLVPGLGSRIDPMALLSPTQIEPLPEECVDPAGAVTVDPALAPQVMVKPLPHGVRLVYPVCEGTIPNEVASPITTPVTPCVLELTVNPLSGTAAYAIDVHYFTGRYMNPLINEYLNGGVQVSVWTTGGVRIASFPSGNHTPARGNPSAVARLVNGHQYVAEFWEVEHAPPQPGPPHPLPRPWSAHLPVLAWADMFPLADWHAYAGELWDVLLPDAVLDFFEAGREHPFADADVPRVSYDSAAGQGSWQDQDAGVTYTLTPAVHELGDFGAMDSLFFDLVDVATGFIPFVGDAADIAELIHAWQTGRDRWGRPITDFELTLMMACAAVPFVSSPFVREAAQALRELPEAATGLLPSRLFTPAARRADYPVGQVEAALAQPSVLRPATPAGASPRRRRDTEALVAAAAEDAATGAPLPSRLAERLLDGTREGWPTVDDLLSEDGTGFASSSLQTAYTRFLRDNPGVGPAEWIEAGDG